MRKYLLFLACALMLTAVVSCSDDDIPAIEYATQGEIKGTVKGTRRNDGVAFEEQFSYSHYQKTEEDHSRYYVYTEGDAPGRIWISFYRGDMMSGGFVRLTLQLSNAADTTPIGWANVSYVKEDEQIFVFTATARLDEFNDELKISNFSFDAESGRLQGDFSFDKSENTTGKDATVTFSADVLLKREIY